MVTPKISVVVPIYKVEECLAWCLDSRNQAVDTGSTQHVCDQFGPDRNTRFIFSILTCPTEIRNNCDYRVC